MILQLLGMPMIPCMMMVLGAVLHKGPGSVNVAPRLIVGVSAFRLIIIPLAGERCFAWLPLAPSTLRHEARPSSKQGPS